MVVLEVYSYFGSFIGFRVIFGNFRGFGLFLVILEVLGVSSHFKGLGLFWSFYRIKGILDIFFITFRVYFYHHIGFRGIFVIS